MHKASDALLLVSTLILGIFGGVMLSSYWSSDDEAPMGRVISTIDVLIAVMLLGFAVMAVLMVMLYA